jgi:O-methyltransferase
MKQLIKSIFRRAGYEVVNLDRPGAQGHYPPDFSQDELKTYFEVRPFTLTSSSPERVVTLIQAVEYLVHHGVPGSFVECGVWRGGSMMAVASTLIRMGTMDRELFLFDTFQNTSPPSAEDGDSAAERWKDGDWADRNEQSLAPLDDVRRNLSETHYDMARVHLIEGMVEATLPASAPAEIALLRLDTDFYESTRHELVHLFPRLASGGILIIDDYGSFQGARKAVDDYLKENGIHLYLQRIDADARIGVKR